MISCAKCGESFEPTDLEVIGTHLGIDIKLCKPCVATFMAPFQNPVTPLPSNVTMVLHPNAGFEKGEQFGATLDYAD